MIDKLEDLKLRYEEVGELIVQPDIISDQKRYRSLTKEYNDLGKIVEKYEEYKLVLDNLANTKEMLKKEKYAEFREMAKAELEELEEREAELESKLKYLLIPKDPNDSKNCIVEIRAGAGGDESALFAGDLLRMYQRYCDKVGWKVSMSDYVEGSAGGYSKVVMQVSGEDVFGKLKFESGVHRVQRVPATESQGRVHTSAATVAVLPEMDDVEVDIDMKDVRKDTFCSSGPGGQSVNTTYSAIRLTHIPSGLVVQCQDEKSQIKNLDKAMKELNSRLYAIKLKEQQEAVGADRKSMVKSGDRSEKIRTYNFPQSRVTDHRINKTVYNLDGVLNGEVGEFIEALQIAENTEKLKAGGLDE
jgi:peptide chain release factor 1